MNGTLQFYMNLDDDYEAEMVRMARQLPRGHLKLWLLKQARLTLGVGGAEDMAKRLKDNLTGGTLEGGHKRQQADDEPLQRPQTSAPLSRPQTSAPLSRPKTSEPLGTIKPDKEPLKKAMQRDEPSMFL